MLNVEQFATIVITSDAINMAKPGNAGANFTWDSWAGWTVKYVQIQWMMANRNIKILEKPKNKALMERIARRVAEDFKIITGKP